MFGLVQAEQSPRRWQMPPPSDRRGRGLQERGQPDPCRRGMRAPWRGAAPGLWVAGGCGRAVSGTGAASGTGMGSPVGGYWRDDARSLRVPRAPERGIQPHATGRSAQAAPPLARAVSTFFPWQLAHPTRPALRGASVDEGSLWEPPYPHFTGQEAEAGRGQLACRRRGPDAGGEGWGLLPSTAYASGPRRATPKWL